MGIKLYFVRFVFRFMSVLSVDFVENRNDNGISERD